MIFALKQAIMLLQLSERDFPKSCHMAHMPPLLQLPLLELGPHAQALSCLLFQVQLNEGTLKLHFFIFISASMAQRRPLVPPS